jgi:hypothetical protein
MDKGCLQAPGRRARGWGGALLATLALLLMLVASASAASRHGSFEVIATTSLPSHVVHRRGHQHPARFHGNPTFRGTQTVTEPWQVPTAPLEFGIYPGGATGDGSGRPDRLSSDVAAVQQLAQPGHPFVVHLYTEYDGPGSESGSAASQVGDEVKAFADAGTKVELVLCYRPADMNAAVDVPGFVAWTQQAVQQLGPYLTYLQVTNEANVDGSTSDTDGAFPGAETALVDGVIGAQEAEATAHEVISNGFNWAYDNSPSSEAFWSQLSSAPAEFFASLGWVGIDIYPGTWGPAMPDLPFAQAISTDMALALQTMRDVDMPLAGIGATVPIHVSETGYPTGPTRSYADESAALQSEVSTVDALRATDNITGFRWFDLRDADTASADDLDQYGLMTDTYNPKPAFYEYRSLVAQDNSGP